MGMYVCMYVYEYARHASWDDAFVCRLWDFFFEGRGLHVNVYTYTWVHLCMMVRTVHGTSLPSCMHVHIAEPCFVRASAFIGVIHSYEWHHSQPWMTADVLPELEVNLSEHGQRTVCSVRKKEVAVILVKALMSVCVCIHRPCTRTTSDLYVCMAPREPLTILSVKRPNAVVWQYRLE